MIINNNYTQMTKKRQVMGEGLFLGIVFKEAESFSLRGFPKGNRGNLPFCHCEPAGGGRGNLYFFKIFS
jgi:hypothetical protein